MSRTPDQIAADRARYEEHQRKGLQNAPKALPGAGAWREAGGQWPRGVAAAGVWMRPRDAGGRAAPAVRAGRRVRSLKGTGRAAS